MSEPLLAHQVVGLKGSLEVIHVDANGAPHQQVLGSFGYLAMSSKEVRSLKSLKAKEVVFKVSGVVDNFIYALEVVLDDFEDLGCKQGRGPVLLVSKVIELLGDGENAAMSPIVKRLDCHAICKLGVVGVDDGHIGTCLGRQISDFRS